MKKGKKMKFFTICVCIFLFANSFATAKTPPASKGGSCASYNKFGTHKCKEPCIDNSIYCWEHRDIHYVQSHTLTEDMINYNRGDGLRNRPRSYTPMTESVRDRHEDLELIFIPVEFDYLNGEKRAVTYRCEDKVKWMRSESNKRQRKMHNNNYVRPSYAPFRVK